MIESIVEILDKKDLIPSKEFAKVMDLPESWIISILIISWFQIVITNLDIKSYR